MANFDQFILSKFCTNMGRKRSTSGSFGSLQDLNVKRISPSSVSQPVSNNDDIKLPTEKEMKEVEISQQDDDLQQMITLKSMIGIWTSSSLNNNTIVHQPPSTVR